MYAPVLAVSSTSLSFDDVAPGETVSMVLTITNAGTGTLSGTITPDKTWVTVDPEQFNQNSVTVIVTVENIQERGVLKVITCTEER